MEVESIIRKGAAGPPAEVQCSRPAEDTQTSIGQGYVNPRLINIEISLSFLEGLSSDLSLQNKQLRTTLPAIQLPANS